MIVSSEGNELVMLGKGRAQKFGDVVAEYTYIEGRPSMILYRPGPTERTRAFVMDMRDAHKYADSKTGGPSKTLFMDSVQAANTIGLTADKYSIKRIMDIILDGLPDLVKMPPSPPKVADKSKDPDGVFKFGNSEVPVWNTMTKE